MWDLHLACPDAPNLTIAVIQNVQRIDQEIVDEINQKLERAGYEERVSIKHLKLVTMPSHQKLSPVLYQKIKNWLILTKVGKKTFKCGDYEIVFRMET